MRTGLALVVVIVTLRVAGQSAASDAAREPRAIVLFVSGEVRYKPADGSAARKLSVYDRLVENVVIESAASSRASLAFVNGSRFEIGPDARARVGAQGLEALRGEARRLEAVPGLPTISPIADPKAAGDVGGTVRIRAGEGDREPLSQVSPRASQPALADRTVLRFRSAEAARGFKVEVENEEGATILAVETRTREVVVSPGVLQPGARYYWRVRSLEPDSPSLVSAFTTLGREQAEQRSRLEDQAAKAASVDLYMLLAAVDSRLGLSGEACRDLEKAESLAPGTDAVAAARDRLACATK